MFMKMELHIKGNGRMIYKMDLEWRHSLIHPSIMGISVKARKMERENSLGKMGQVTMVSLRTINFIVMGM